MVAIGRAASTFLSWTTPQGIQTPLELSQRPEGRFTICKRDISPGDDLLSIPLSSCLKSDSLENLAEKLAHEKNRGSKSKFAPYIEFLPTLEGDEASGRPALSHLPRFWKGKRLDLVLDGGQLDARMRRDERPDIDQWALACVDSRANFLGDGMGYAMTPMLDMINHDGTAPTCARIDKDKGFSGAGDILHLTTGKSFSKGDEAFISYGALTNLDTLADYGFVTPQNPFNSESVQVRMMRRDPFPITVFADGSVDAGSKATLRYYLANEAELEQFSTLEDGTGLGIIAKKISDRNELDVSSFIASTLAEAAYEAQMGAEDATIADDGLVSTYLKERANTFNLAIERLKRKYPDLEY
mmetsp:Transcript_4849/g.9873  ORF Transcript_4849/g.9873 Transcript_4849/m.9873 type:complete len:356 (+) Transcript_4849:32-1099(+)